MHGGYEPYFRTPSMAFRISLVSLVSDLPVRGLPFKPPFPPDEWIFVSFSMFFYFCFNVA
jgi:hypothetical protein